MTSDTEWKFVSEEAITFIKRLMTVDYKRRPTAELALEDYWIEKNSKTEATNSEPMAIDTLYSLISFNVLLYVTFRLKKN